MTTNKISILFLVCISILILKNDSYSKETIIWGHACIPPIYICDDSKLTGVAADIDNIIFENLKEYDHKHVRANLERILQTLKNKGLSCSSFISKNAEREKFLYYSIPAAIVPPIYIFIRKDDYAAFGNTNVISLENTLKNSKLKFGYPSFRSFGQTIDSIIKDHAKEAHIFPIYSSEIIKQQIILLKDKRIDYTIGGYFEINLAAAQQGTKSEIMPLKIEEKHDYLVLYIVCPKNEWGKMMIDKINEILRKEIPTQRYFDCFKPFYDQIDKNEVRMQYEKLLLTPISK